jgi:hypothetical protein
MKPILATAALAAAMMLPAAFAQAPPPIGTPDNSAEAAVDAQAAHAQPEPEIVAQPQILQGTPEAALAAKADADRQSVELVAAKNNGEPVAAEVARVVESGKPYTTDDLVRAQRVAMNLDAGAPNPAAQTSPNTTKTPGQAGVFDSAISTDKASSITAAATDAKIPNQPAKPATAENTAKPEPSPPVEEPAPKPEN